MTSFGHRCAQLGLRPGAPRMRVHLDSGVDRIIGTAPGAGAGSMTQDAGAGAGALQVHCATTDTMVSVNHRCRNV